MTTLRLYKFIEDVEISAALYGMVQRIEAAAIKVRKTFAIWASRTEDRRHLAELDDHMLKDIGLTRAAVLGEFDKHFWQQ
jgi:uncharacterized protein YjiS (DUF1127 family)